MEEIGLVTKVQGRLLQVEIPRSKACGGCRACVPLDGKDSMTTFVVNECGARPGDRVVLAPADESRRLFSALYLYGIPLLVFLAAILIGSRFLNELYCFLAAIGALGLSYLLLYLRAKKMNQERYMHRAVRLASSEEKPLE